VDHERFGALVEAYPTAVIIWGAIGLILGGFFEGWPGKRSYPTIAIMMLAGSVAVLAGWAGWPFDLAFIAGWFVLTGWCVIGALLALAGGRR
jgi:hypothetical protein